MTARSASSLAAAALLIVAGCSSGGSSGAPATPTTRTTGSAGPGGTQPPGGATTPPSPSPGQTAAALTAAMEARRRDYIDGSIAGRFGGQNEGYYTQIMRLHRGVGPLDRAPLDDMMDFVDARPDTADFKATALVRLVYVGGADPLLPADLQVRARRTLLDFKYWVDEPGRDDMIFWSENHYVMFAAAGYLAGQLYPQDTFTNSGITGADQMARMRPRLVRWLDDRIRFGFAEWNSPVYYPHDVAPLMNLIDFCADAEIRGKAEMVMDLLVFDLARFTHRGSFGVTAGRVYEEHKLSGHRQSIGDLIEILFGTRGSFRGRSSTAATSFATSTRYRVPPVLLAVGQDAPARLLARTRHGASFSEAGLAGRGFTDLEDGMLWWTMGGYVAPETIVLSRRMVRAWDLWHYSFFTPLQALDPLPDVLLSAASSALNPVSRGPLLSTANAVTFRTQDAMLSSVQSYRRGSVGFQQHAWQATLDLDAAVFTTHPGFPGRDGPGDWTGSASMPRVIQVEDTAVILYNPLDAMRLVFPRRTHAFFPRAAFDEVREQGSWTFGRKGDGYIALYSARPTRWQTAGTYADRELIADGDRNAWLCQIGNAAEDGPFADFVATVAGARVDVTGAGNAPKNDPFGVRFEAPGVGLIDVDWDAPPTLDGAPIAIDGFGRYDSPYARKAVTDDALRVELNGLSLDHDYRAETRTGTGL